MASSIQLLRSTKAQERPFPNNLLEGQPALNLNSTEPGLFFKATDGSLVKVGPAAITADGSPPNASATGLAGNTVGEMWLDKSVVPPVLKIYDGATWVDAGSGSGGGGGSNVSLLRWAKTAIGGETFLSGSDNSGLQLSYTPGLEQVFLNGVLLERGTDYIGTNGTAFSNLAALTAGDVVMVLSYSPISVGSLDASSISYMQQGVGAQQRTVENRLRDEYYAGDFGILGDGSDETSKLQAAIDAIYTAGGGTLLIPYTASGYKISTPLRLKPRVSIAGTGGSPLIENTQTSGGIGKQEVFLVGNFHPDFTEEWTYYPCGTVQAGNKVTVSNAGDSANFSVGDQVAVSSSATTSVGGFTIPVYMCLSTVHSINGAEITLNESIDTTFVGGIARVASVNGRNGIPLFFSYNSVVSDLTLKSNFYSWTVDTACLNVMFKRLNIYASTAIYGNTFQNTQWIDCNFYFSRSIGEQSHNSLNTIADRCNFIYWNDGGLAPSGGISIQECARKIRYQNCTLVMSPNLSSGSLITVINAQDVVFDKLYCSVSSSSYGAVSLIQFNPSATTNFPAIGRIVKNSVFDVGSCARFFRVNGASDPVQINNGLDNCVFRGSNTQPDSVYLLDSVGSYVKNCTIPSKALFIAGTSSKNIIENNFIAGGFNGETSGDESFFKKNFIRNNRSEKSEVKTAIQTQSYSVTTVGPLSSSDVVDVPLSNSLIPRDKIDLSAVLDIQGTTGSSEVTFYFRDNTLSSDRIVSQIVLPASSPGLYSLSQTLYFTSTKAVGTYTLVDPSGAVSSATQVLTTINRLNDLSLRVGINSSGGDAVCSIESINLNISNPYYS